MKRLHLLPLCLVAMLTILSSCTLDEDLLGEAIAENENQDPPVDPPGEHEGVLDINTTPCDYDLSVLSADETLLVDCQLDLGGGTVNLPANVTIDYDGGEIINGTLNFNGGKIGGNILNQNLEVTGSVSLISETFQFHHERWDFVQGTTTSAIAQNNNTNLENLMAYTKQLGATNFLIDHFDAYFEVGKVTSTTTNQNFYPSEEAINVPGNFNLIMSENTVLRVFPNDRGNAVLMAARDVSNILIKGGTLYGDRDGHDYSTSNPGEGGAHLLYLHAATNITVDGVTMTMGSAGALIINALNFYFQPNYLPSHDIVIKNCLFDKNRRMATAITDGHNIVVENNIYRDTGLDMSHSDGGVVAYAINLEGVREREPNGNLKYFERVYDVTIRNNTESGSRVGGFNIFTGERIEISGNTMESKITYSFGSDCKITNNILTASSYSENTPAIVAGGSGDTVFNNEISNNQITGYSNGISAAYKDIKIFDNVITNCGTAIQLKAIKDTEIYNNQIISNDPSSRGIMAHVTDVNNVEIYGNDITVEKDQLYFVSLNQGAGEENNNIDVHDNNFLSEGKVTFSNAAGVSFTNNELIGGMQVVNTENLVLSSNNITAEESHGIHLRESISNVTIELNTIGVTGHFRFVCIQNDANGSVNIVGNNCAD